MSLNIIKNKYFYFTAILEKRNYKDKERFGTTRVLLREVRIGKLLFRDHLWVLESKKLKIIKNNIKIKFRAKIKEYINADAEILVDKNKKITYINQFKHSLCKLSYISQISINDKIDLKHFKGNKCHQKKNKFKRY